MLTIICTIMQNASTGCRCQATQLTGLTRVLVWSQAVPPWALALLCLSKRVHSIFILRMFNDSITMMLAYTACLLLIRKKWRLAVFLFSAALSVKMNVLLMAPPVLVIMLKVNPPVMKLATHCLLCTVVHLSAPYPDCTLC